MLHKMVSSYQRGSSSSSRAVTLTWSRLARPEACAEHLIKLEKH